CIGLLEVPRREPLPEIVRRCGTVRPQVTAADLAQAFLLVHLLPALDPLIRTGERDLASLRRSLTELGAEEHEAREQAPLSLRSDASGDLGGQLFAQQTTAVERVQDRGVYLLHVSAAERRMQFAFRIDPGLQLVRLVR